MFSVRIERIASDGTMRHELHAAKDVQAVKSTDGASYTIKLVDGADTRDILLDGVAVAYVMNASGNTVWMIETDGFSRRRSSSRVPAAAGAKR